MSPTAAIDPAPSAQSASSQPDSPRKAFKWLSRSKTSTKASLAALGARSSTAPASSGSGSLFKISSREGRDKPRESTKDSVGLSAVKKAIVGAVVDDWPLYSCRPEDYSIGAPIGFGSSSTVYLATYCPASSGSKPAAPIRCAIKVVDVDRLSSAGDIDRLRRETQLMALSKHPNVLRVRGEWVDPAGKLYIACRFMAAGSLQDISRWAWPDGFPEDVIATVLRQALEGLWYLHVNGWLHRDIKAANLLCDDDGTILLADFGVSSSLFADGPASASASEERVPVGRKSFVGTPCYMAPEIVQRKAYDTKADIWSLGITALELAAGRAPNSLYAPAKVLSKTLLDESPKLDRDGGKYRYSKQFADFVDLCLLKDPKKRPTAEKLLHHGFIKAGAKPKKFLVGAILDDLPPLEARQDRRRKASLGGEDTMGSWDFSSGTLPAGMTLKALRTLSASPSFASASDPFANFAFNRAPSAPQSPTAAGFPSGRRIGSAGREREPSTGSRRHQRGVSFDLADGGARASSATATTDPNVVLEAADEGSGTGTPPREEEEEAEGLAASGAALSLVGGVNSPAPAATAEQSRAGEEAAAAPANSDTALTTE